LARLAALKSDADVCALADASFLRALRGEGPVKPRIAITVGDPAGIGPEIAAKAAAEGRVLAVCEPVLYGPGRGSPLRAGHPFS
jgi:hypothetical protein